MTATAAMLEAAEQYLDIGLVLAPIPAGTKGPRTPGWNTPAVWIDSRERAQRHWGARPQDGMGLIHAPSGTCALDIDDLPRAREAFARLGLDLDGILSRGWRIVGRGDRAKAIFGVEHAIAQQLTRHVYAVDGVTVFELRGGFVQDCLPPTLHPDTGLPYQNGNGRPGNDLPTVGQDLLDLWFNWPETLARLTGAVPVPSPAPRAPCPATDTSVIEEYNAAVSREAVLGRNGYKRRGTRWIAPTSETGTAGVVPLEGGRVFSHHGADPLADGHAHDAFDLLRLLEHRGDVRAAVKAAAEQLGRPKPNGRRPGAAPATATGTPPAPAAAKDASDLSDSDTGNASRLVARHGERLHYIAIWRKWLVWLLEQGRWSLDHGDVVVREMAKGVGLTLRATAAHAEDRKLFAFALRTLDSHGISGMVDLARGIPGILLDHEALDCDPWKLGVANGTVDLRAGALRAADPADLMMMQAPTRYDAEALAPRWTQALREWFPDEEVRAYVQRLAGSALVGAQIEHVFVIHYGGGRNGKGTFIRALEHVLGPYAGGIHLSLLVETKWDQHDTVKAALFRTRLAVASETKRRVRLHEANVKNLSGGDRIFARRMREDLWGFNPTHSLWLQTNHLPEISGRDVGIWSRIRVVKWVTTFSDQQQDRTLDATLAAEAPGILGWLVEGCLEWQRVGLAEPEAVIRETLAYRQAEDVFSRFAADAGLVFDRHAKIQAGVLQGMLSDWAHDEGLDLSRQELGGWLKEHDAKRRREREIGADGEARQVRYWVGVGLRGGPEEEAEALLL